MSKLLLSADLRAQSKLVDIHSLEWSDRFADGLVSTGSLPRLAWKTPLAPNPRLWAVAGAFRGQYNQAVGMATTGSLTRW